METKEQLKIRKAKYYEENKEKILTRNKLWRDKNKEHTKEYMLEYKKNNADKISNTLHKWYLRNRERLSPINKIYRENNKEKIKEYHKKHREENREKYRQYWRDYKAKKKCVIEEYSLQEWVELKNATKGVCPNCKTYVSLSKLTLDHIYPIHKAYKNYLKTGIKYVYTINDIQPLCGTCNYSKGTKTKENIKKVYGQKYLNGVKQDEIQNRRRNKKS